MERNHPPDTGTPEEALYQQMPIEDTQQLAAQLKARPTQKHYLHFNSISPSKGSRLNRNVLSVS